MGDPGPNGPNGEPGIAFAEIDLSSNTLFDDWIELIRNWFHAWTARMNGLIFNSSHQASPVSVHPYGK